MQLNVFFLSGKMVNAPRLGDNGGVPVCEFKVSTLAYLPQSKMKYEYAFFDCRATGNFAKAIVEHFKKGDFIQVTGRIRYRVRVVKGIKVPEYMVIVKEFQHALPTKMRGIAMEEFDFDITPEEIPEY